MLLRKDAYYLLGTLPQQHARRVSPNATRARLVRSTWTPNAVQLQHQSWAIHVPLRLTAESGPLQRRLSPSAFRGPARKQSAAAIIQCIIHATMNSPALWSPRGDIGTAIRGCGGLSTERGYSRCRSTHSRWSTDKRYCVCV